MTAAALLICTSVFGPRGPLPALMLNAFVLIEIAGFSQGVRWPVPVRYFRPGPIERPWIYEGLGIRAFKQLMRSRLYRRINPSFHLVGGRRGLAEIGQHMESAEAAHALVFVIVTVFAAGALWIRWIDAAAWITLFNVLLNGYPVMLQRYNRLRLERLLRNSR